jgi:hypothetical protein
MAVHQSHKSFRPVTVATFKATNLLFGMEPFAFRIGNLLLHATVCALFAGLARQCLAFSPRAQGLATVAFLLHPIHTEAVRVPSA